MSGYEIQETAVFKAEGARDIYTHSLPLPFPYFIDLPPKVCQGMARELLNVEKEPLLDGSSFAVTVVEAPRTWRLWLSAASKTRVEAIVHALNIVEGLDHDA